MRERLRPGVEGRRGGEGEGSGGRGQVAAVSGSQGVLNGGGQINKHQPEEVQFFLSLLSLSYFIL